MDQDQPKPKRGESKRHDEEFKRSVVEHWLSSGQSAAKVARDFGVNVWNLRDWKERYAAAPKGVDDAVPESPAEMKREIQQLRKELARTIHQREILKKTLGIISEA
jgi:transposase-like protein